MDVFLKFILFIYKKLPLGSFKNGASSGMISEPLKDVIISIDIELNQVLIQKIQRLIAA
ncbi:MAG TPA: hypothetical protein H9673_05305 [Candidatus Adamsella sp.]|nr:hypothetical protein [Candidatus Adamsella sp.]